MDREEAGPSCTSSSGIASHSGPTTQIGYASHSGSIPLTSLPSCAQILEAKEFLRVRLPQYKQVNKLVRKANGSIVASDEDDDDFQDGDCHRPYPDPFTLNKMIWKFQDEVKEKPFVLKSVKDLCDSPHMDDPFSLVCTAGTLLRIDDSYYLESKGNKLRVMMIPGLAVKAPFGRSGLFYGYPQGQLTFEVVFFREMSVPYIRAYCRFMVTRNTQLENMDFEDFLPKTGS